MEPSRELRPCMEPSREPAMQLRPCMEPSTLRPCNDPSREQKKGPEWPEASLERAAKLMLLCDELSLEPVLSSED